MANGPSSAPRHAKSLIGFRRVRLARLYDEPLDYQVFGYPQNTRQVMTAMEQDAERVATEVFGIFKQLVTRRYSSPDIAQLAASVDLSDPTLAMYAASKLVDPTAAKLGVTGGARVMAQQKLLEKLKAYYDNPEPKRSRTSPVVIVLVLLLIAFGIYWFGIRAR